MTCSSTFNVDVAQIIVKSERQSERVRERDRQSKKESQSEGCADPNWPISIDH